MAILVEQLHASVDRSCCGSGAGEAGVQTALLLHLCQLPEQPAAEERHVSLE